MGKATGLLGNYNGKVGNTVGYDNKASSNRQTQGVRVHQPKVNNPKTYAQAEQRAKVAPINATYRALKGIIIRCQEVQTAGNASRLAWFKAALKAHNMPWFEKGAVINAPVLCILTRGSLDPEFSYAENNYNVSLKVPLEDPSVIHTIGDVSRVIISKYPRVHVGDRFTFVSVFSYPGSLDVQTLSFNIDPNNTTPKPLLLSAANGAIYHGNFPHRAVAGCAFIARRLDSRKILYSTSTLVHFHNYPLSLLTPEAKEDAVKSYMSAADNSDWPEEQVSD